MGVKEHPYIPCQTEVFNLFLDLPKKHLHLKCICTFVYMAFASKMLAIHQQLNGDASQEPGELGEVNAALLSFAKLLRISRNGFHLAYKLLCLRNYAPGVTFYLP